MLTKITSDTFSQLKFIIDQLSTDEFTQKLTILNHSSVGQHVRHILEFYVCLSSGIKNGIVDYDNRRRNLSIENDPNYAIIILDELSALFCHKNIEETSLINKTEFNGAQISSNSSVSRELVYLIEHSIHHYAIIGIALRNEFKHIEIPMDFGVAYSTTKHKHSIDAALTHDHA